MRYVGRLLALALVIGLLAAVEIWLSYRQATTAAEGRAAGFARLLAEQSERIVQAIDFTLISMRSNLAVVPSPPAHDPSYRARMLDWLKRLRYVRALFVVGPDGFVTHDTNPPGLHHQSLADRPYFRVHRDNPHVGLHIGKPLRSRPGGVWFFSLSRRITNPDGSFGGVVVAAVEPRYFKGFYEEVSTGDDGVIALLYQDGTLLARVPHYEETIGTSYANAPSCKQAQIRGSGIAWGTSPVDGTRRVVASRTLDGAPLIVIAGWSARSVYASWRGRSAIVSIAAALVWVLAFSLAMLSLKYRRRERLEQLHLAQVQRLETMGRIAGGIAHDLGNTIKIARTTFALLKPSLTTQQDAMALVEDADRSLKSAFEIIDSLLAFARRQELSPRCTDLAELISGFAPILRHAADPCTIELDLVIARPLICSIDPIHFESALLNLVLNSKDAMPSGGRIVIDLREAQPPRRLNKTQPRMPATLPWAEIIVRDDGEGMSRDVLDRAVEPFFTTRRGGSGLGLSQVLGFVHQSAGEFRMESQVGCGTTVRLLFPTACDRIEPSPAGPAGAAS